MIRTLEANTAGRDFVCGDIHGSWSCLQRFMDGVEFDPSKDRLISAGDLVDRGPENEKCLALLYEPWFYMVKGNHEELMESYFKKEALGQMLWACNGGMWGLRHETESSNESLMVRDVASTILPKLPLLITVRTPSGGRFHVIHAEMWAQANRPLTDELLEDEEAFKRFAFRQSYDGDCILWGRLIFASAYGANMEDPAQLAKFVRTQKYYHNEKMFGKKLSPIFSGHTPLLRPLQFMKHTNLDTMAYASYSSDAKPWQGLTVAEPTAGKFWFANDREFRETTAVVVNL